MVQYAAHGYLNTYGIAAAYAELGDADHAFVWLDRAYDQRTIWLADLPTDQELVSLHADPRWAAFLSRMGVTR